MGLLDRYIKIMDQFNKILLWFIGVLVGIMAVLIFAQVFFRYVVNQSLSWSEEVARYIMIWTVFLGTSIALRRKTLIAVEAIVQFIPKKIEVIFRIVVLLISLIFCLYLIVQGIDMTQRVVDQRSTAMGIPMWIPYASVPVGAVLIILNIFVVMIETVRDRAVKGGE